MPCQRMFSRVCFLSLSSSAASAVVNSCCLRRLAMLCPSQCTFRENPGKTWPLGSVVERRDTLRPDYANVTVGTKRYAS